MNIHLGQQPFHFSSHFFFILLGIFRLKRREINSTPGNHKTTNWLGHILFCLWLALLDTFRSVSTLLNGFSGGFFSSFFCENTRGLWGILLSQFFVFIRAFKAFSVYVISWGTIYFRDMTRLCEKLLSGGRADVCWLETGWNLFGDGLKIAAWLADPPDESNNMLAIKIRFRVENEYVDRKPTTLSIAVFASLSSAFFLVFLMLSS